MLPSPVSPLDPSQSAPTAMRAALRFECPGKNCQLHFCTFQDLARHLSTPQGQGHSANPVKCPVCGAAPPIQYLLSHLQAIVDERHASFISGLRDLDIFLHRYLVKTQQGPNGIQTPAGSTPQSPANSGPPQFVTPPVPDHSGPNAQVPSPPPSHGDRTATPTGGAPSTNPPSSNPVFGMSQQPGSVAGQKRSANAAFQNAGAVQHSGPGGQMPQSLRGNGQRSLREHYSLCAQMFQRHMGTLKNAETCRLATLAEASQLEDHGFLAFHQILCLEIHEPQTTKDVLKFTLPSRRGLMELDKLLNMQDSVRPQFFKFWSHFPSDIRALVSTNRLYQTLVPATMKLCESFERCFQPLKARCAARQYPPSTGELSSELQITSAVLQRVLFHCIAQSTWSNSSYQSLHNAMMVFQIEDQRVWGRLCAENRRHEYSDHHMRAIWLDFKQNGFQSPTASLPYTGNDATLTSHTAPPPAAKMLTSCTQHPQSTNSNSQVAQLNPSTSLGRPGRPLVQARSLHVNTNQQQPPLAPAVAPPPTPGQLLSPLDRFNLENVQPSPNPLQMQPRQLSTQTQRGGLPLTAAGISNSNSRKASMTPSLRSPCLTAVDAKESTFQSVSEFTLLPTALDSSKPNQVWHFELPEGQFLDLPRDVPGEDAKGKPTRLLKPTSSTYRLRCVEGQPPENLSEWASRDVTWPTGFMFKLNEKFLPFRVKLDRCVPMDLTRFLYPNQNTLEIVYAHVTLQKIVKPRSLAVERVTVQTKSQIMDQVKGNVVPRADVISAIRKALLPSSNNDGSSDDIQCLSTSIVIAITDPIMAISIWEIPVRTKSCKHREAFDLETFLTTRRDPKAADDVPCSPDVWSCPICSADARPTELLVDGFLAEVRSVLKKQGRLETAKFVEVDEDGMWNARAVKEECGSSSVPSSPPPVRNDGLLSAPPAVKPRKASVEIVDLTL
ncbi:MAG: hypothetical protein Q9162_002929 [Coniocarpon cinnabarinum]